MPTVIDRQVEAFRLSVQEIALEGEEVSAEAADVLQELLDFGKFVAGQVTKGGTKVIEQARPEAAGKFAEQCRGVLGVMVDAQRLFDEVRAEVPGLVLQGEDEFNDAIVELRDLIAELEGAAAGVSRPAPASEQERAKFREEFQRLAEANPPPQSWFDEDFSALAGPGGA